MRQLDCTFAGTPMLSCSLTHTRESITARIRTTTLAQAGELRLSDGVEELRIAGLELKSSRDLGDGSIELMLEAALPTIDQESAQSAIRRGECISHTLDGKRVTILSERALPQPPETTLAFRARKIPTPRSLKAIAPQTLTLLALKDEWQPVVQDAKGGWTGLEDELGKLGIAQSDFSEWLLHPEHPNPFSISDERAHDLARSAYRAFRYLGELPQGKALPEAELEHSASLFGSAPSDTPVSTPGPMRRQAAALEYDEEGGLILRCPQMMVHLKHKGGPDTITPHGYTIDSQSAMRVRAHFLSEEESLLASYLTGGTGPAQELRIPRAMAIRDRASASSSSQIEEAQRVQAQALLSELAGLWPTLIESAEYSGPFELTPTLFQDVIFQADAEAGLRTIVRERNDWLDILLDALTHDLLPSLQGRSAESVEPNPTPRNAYRGGPTILRDDHNDDQREAKSFAALVGKDDTTHALSLERFGRLAQPFWVDDAKGEGGAWFMAAPVKLSDAGLQILEDALDPSNFSAPSKVENLGDETPVPKGSDGVIMQGMDGQTHLALYDRSLVAQHRGDRAQDHSSLVREIAGEWLDPDRAGALHHLVVVTLSPQALRESSGKGLADAWIAALNFRDAASATPSERALLGRGRFAEVNGKSLGQLAHLPNQAGPIVADAASCQKHKLGESLASDGVYRECAGHIATDAFFKVVGSSIFDGPLHFQKEESTAKIGRGREYRAEIKFDPSIPHHFYGREKPGRWVVTYRVPLWDGVPPTWRPREDPPYVIDRNLAGPSYDWVPPDCPPNYKAPPEPGDHDDFQDIDYPGPVVSSTGYAVKDSKGQPQPASGGGVAVMPGGVLLSDGPDYSFEGAMRWFTLHPSVGLGFGLADMEEDGAPKGGYQLAMDGDALVLNASNDNSSPMLCVNVPLEAKQGFAGDAPAVTGSRSDGSALATLLSALDELGLIDDQSVA